MPVFLCSLPGACAYCVAPRHWVRCRQSRQRHMDWRRHYRLFCHNCWYDFNAFWPHPAPIVMLHAPSDKVVSLCCFLFPYAYYTGTGGNFSVSINITSFDTAPDCDPKVRIFISHYNLFMFLFLPHWLECKYFWSELRFTRGLRVTALGLTPIISLRLAKAPQLLYPLSTIRYALHTGLMLHWFERVRPIFLFA